MRIDLRTATRAGPRDGHNYRTLLDGVEVTKRCFLADDETGEVGLYLVDVDGHFYRNEATDDAAQEVRHGAVVLIPPPATLDHILSELRAIRALLEGPPVEAQPDPVERVAAAIASAQTAAELRPYFKTPR